jgi:hypothetical protein
MSDQACPVPKLMLASRAFSIDFVSGFIQIGSGRTHPTGASPRHPLIHALGPALDMAYGLEHASLIPDEIRGLADRLLAGPLGVDQPAPEPVPAETALETA